MLDAVFANPAGGFRYHLRAARHAKQLWEPYRWALGEWLLEWRPPQRNLILVGPSGGYCLQPFVLERFERVIVLEPDPWARWVLRRRIRSSPLERQPALEFISEDHLIADPSRLLDRVERDQAAVLFCNVLGQVRVLLDTESGDSPALARLRDVLKELWQRTSVASFHDRVSGDARPVYSAPMSALTRLSDEELIQEIYGAHDAESTQLLAHTLLDHLTQGFFPEDRPHHYFSWELMPGTFHLIEAVRSGT